MQKTVLISGCSSGFGLSTTRRLLDAGWKVIATARNPKNCDELNKINSDSLVILPLDVTQDTDLKHIQYYLSHELEGQLDCLINNAGYGLLGPFEELSIEQIHHQFAVNVFGLMQLTQICLPFLRKTQGRIINVSSVLGYVGLPLHSLYVSSKYALEGFTESLYYELASFNVQVALIEPGAHSTRFGSNAVSPTPANDNGVYTKQKNSFVRYKQKLTHGKNGSSEKFADCIVRLLKKNSMPLRTRLGLDAQLVYLLKYLLPASWCNRIFKYVFKRMF